MEIAFEDYIVLIEQKWGSSTHKNGKLLWRSNPYIKIRIYKLVKKESLDIEEK